MGWQITMELEIKSIQKKKRGIDRASNKQETYQLKVCIQGEKNSKWKSG